jgi:hypothetical protein
LLAYVMVLRNPNKIREYNKRKFAVIKSLAFQVLTPPLDIKIVAGIRKHISLPSH